MSKIRETASRHLYESDLDLDNDTSVTDIIDLMERFGTQIAQEYYRKGVSDSILNRVERNPKDE
jgi:hypothetical protein